MDVHTGMLSMSITLSLQSQMKDDPQHYGKLDHGDKKGTTLPGAVVPPTAEGYGKVDRVCLYSHTC